MVNDIYKYLFVGLTSSSDLQPHLIGEERRGSLSRLSSTIYSGNKALCSVRDYSLSDIDGWLVFTSQRHEEKTLLWSWSPL